ncbi:acetyl-CoA C-acyltransferase [Acidovorax sp. MR-S7]|uniref:acetyl-CoA C-acyltransferase n=1 Tax=Acidovorax sp. MR-S7 TaxID=1268622 RepID=UPI000362E90C|nr:acetyl-CoA C-acyltransferase [Acidovorax sp. MR-S7]
MSQAPFSILAWARTPVAPVGGALSRCQPHDLAAPLLARLLADSGLPADRVDAVVLGNALGAGGNPARMLALAAGLPERTPAATVDTQCCAGLDAITHACGLLALGQAQVVVAGGAEAWSRAPLRHHRPLEHGAAPVPYDSPPFAPWPDRDPGMLQAAAAWAQRHGVTRAAQDAWAAASHARAAAARGAMAGEIVPLNGLAHDAYPRERLSAARMPAVAGGGACAVGTAAVSPRADGAALLLLATHEACARLGLRARALWHGASSVGGAPEVPMLCAAAAARAAQARSGWPLARLDALELHDAFAAQGIAFCDELGLPPGTVNRQGGGLARGHPIGASGAIALVRVLAQLQATPSAAPRGMACIAGAGGLGTAAWVSMPREGA